MKDAGERETHITLSELCGRGRASGHPTQESSNSEDEFRTSGDAPSPASASASVSALAIASASAGWPPLLEVVVTEMMEVLAIDLDQGEVLTLSGSAQMDRGGRPCLVGRAGVKWVLGAFGEQGCEAGEGQEAGYFCQRKGKLDLKKKEYGYEMNMQKKKKKEISFSVLPFWAFF